MYMALEYSTKEAAYFDNVRDEILPFFSHQLNTILEVGCGTGGTLAFLKERGLCRTTIGIELFPEAFEKAKATLDLGFCGDIETMSLPIRPGTIDAILCLDVLEHLIDPWQVIDKLTEFLAPTGFILTSIPNVRHVRVLLPLAMRGEWQYQNDGLLDKTHLRFFTKNSAIRMLSTPRLTVAQVALRYRSRRVRKAARFVPTPLRDFLASQFIVQAKLR